MAGNELRSVPKILEYSDPPPYGWQQDFLNNMRTYNVLVAPRQHGKTRLVVSLITEILYDPNIKNPFVTLGSDTAKRVFSLYSKDLRERFAHHKDFSWTDANKTLITIKRKEGDKGHIKIYGANIQRNPIKGQASHGNFLDEAGSVDNCSHFVKENLLPTTYHTKGVTVITGTVEPNSYFDLYQFANKERLKPDSNWYSFLFRFKDKWSREIFSNEDIKRIEEVYDFDNKDEKLIFEKEMMCNWYAGMKGTPYTEDYMRALEDGRIGHFPFNPNFKVGTTWDNGMGYTAVWFWQMEHFRPRFVGFMQWKEESLQRICADINEWYRDRKAEPYVHIFPHTMNQRQQALNKLRLWKVVMGMLLRGARKRNVPRVQNLEIKVQATKNLIRCAVFDEASCAYGLKAISMYRRRMNKQTGSPQKEFVKDAFSHGAEALGELAMLHASGKIFEEPDDFDEEHIPRNTYQLNRSILTPY